MKREAPKEAIDILIASLAPATAKQYESALHRWGQFCNQNYFEFYAPSRKSLLSFLTVSFKEGASYSTLNTYRSAVSLISQDKLGEDVLVSRFLKGAYRLKPSKPKYPVTWDVSVVLKHLKTLHPLEKLSLKELTEKTVVLLALCTPHRTQTLASIKISNICATPRGLEIKIPDAIKTSGPGRFQPLLILPKFKDDLSLCVASVITKYLDVTKELRGKSDNLFIAIKSPHRAIGSQTVSRWIKTELRNSGVDISIFSAHSMRHAATSAALARGVDLSVIRRTAGWTESSHTFAKFYNRPIIPNNDSFASAVIQT